MPVNPFTFNCLLPATQFITASYADQDKTTPLNGFKARLPDYERPQGAQKSRSARPQRVKIQRRTLRYVEPSERCENDAGGLVQHPAKSVDWKA
jgi:hypothetical protein